MKLGNFSVSLSVKDIKISKEFYQKLGFEVIHGDEKQGWLILKNEETNIGLFQGMFDKNMLTFNPGWDSEGKNVDPFMDIREIQQKPEAAGVEFDQKVENETGPASFMIKDPDGNPILVDQHR